MILAGLMGSVSSASGGGTPTATWVGLAFDPLNEGQQQTITIDFTNWNGSSAYWTVTNTTGSMLSGQVYPATGQLSPGYGDSTQQFSFTPIADQTTDGPLTYQVRIGSSSQLNDYFNSSNYTIRDSSQAPTLVLDLDSNNWASQTWTDTSGQNNGASTANMSKSTDNGGVLILNGTSAFANVGNLQNSTYGSITISAWIKPSNNYSTQTILAKELCYKLRLTDAGNVAMMAGPGYAPWVVNFTSNIGTIASNQWQFITATVNSDYSRIYINGVLAQISSGTIIGANNQVVDIGAYSGDGNATRSDYFSGAMGEVKLWNYALNAGDIADEYNATCGRYGLTPIPNSLTFFRSQSSYLKYDSSTSDWNMGDTYTIEWWARLNLSNYSNGSVYPVVCQEANTTGIDVFYNNGYIQVFNGEIKVAQPAAGTWHHVAVVKDSTTLTVYVNGHSRSIIAPIGNSTLSNGSLPLFVGARVNSSGVIYSNQVFDGELAGIRINNTALYTGTFTPERIPTAPSGTKLLLNGYNPWTDQSTSGHSQTGNNVIHTSEFPKLPFSGGTGSAASSANGFTVTPSIAGRANASTAYAGDTITWTITSNAGWGGYTMYYWVDNNAIPANTFVENSIDGGPISLDSNGSATFTRTVAQNVGLQFRMLIGHTIYQGGDYPFHGFIGV